VSARIEQSAYCETEVLRFAALAAEFGWSRATFERFCSDEGVAPPEAARRWPGGERSLAWSFNETADEAMLSSWRGVHPTLVQILRARFEQNEPHKRAVAALALSDALHPFNTLQRTSQTAMRMLELCALRRSGWFACWSLVFAYSLVVLVWLADKTPDRRRTDTAVRALSFVLGLR